MNSIFWKVLAVAAVASVFYVGYGLQELRDSHSQQSVVAVEGERTANDWEYVNFELPKGSNARRAVPGGWLLTLYQKKGDADVFGVTFVPDPDHKWKLL